VGGVELAAKSMLHHDAPGCDFRLLFIDQRPSAPGWRWRRWAAAFQAPGDILKAWRRSQAFAPDVVICSLWKSVPLSLLLCVGHPKRRLAFFLHNDVAMHPADALLSRVAMRFADAIWADSPSTLAARRVPASKISRTISFVLDRPASPAERSPSYRFVSWGRLNDQKGFDRAIDLVALIRDRGHQVDYEIFGPDDGARGALERRIATLGLSGHVRLRGAIAKADIAAAVADRSLFLQLSRSEGMCMAAVEAMQLGLVPVATPVGHMRVYVEPGRSGIIVDPRHLSEAADAVVDLLADEGRYASHSRAARQYWQKASTYAEDVCAAIEEIRPSA
jgi:glycosyltransferase involved in cell wall biosynthesis